MILKCVDVILFIIPVPIYILHLCADYAVLVNYNFIIYLIVALANVLIDYEYMNVY